MKCIGLIFVSFLFIAGCTSFRDEQKLQCGEVTYVKGFPLEVELQKNTPLPLDLAGCVDVFAVDSLMIFKMMDGEYFWKIFSLNGNRFLCCFLSKGHGHDEFESLPSSELVMRTDTALLCDFWSSSRRVWYRCNLTRTIQNQYLVWEKQQRFEKIDNILYTFCLSDTLFYFIKNRDYTGFIRSLYANGTFHDLIHVGNLNDFVVNKDINTLSAVRCLNRKRMMMAEGMLRLNQINLYSLVADSSKTICIGDELSNVYEVDHLPKKMRHKYYGNILSYDNYFVALYHDVSVMDYWMGKDYAELQFFDWSGQPLLLLKFPFAVTSFFVSQNRYVYVFSNIGEEEVIYKYDCGEILRSIT